MRLRLMLAGALVAERFQVDELACATGMSAVYRARDRLTGERVALKVARAHAAQHEERFVREACVLAELRHPGIVRYVAHGVTPSRELYLAMEWLDGEDLAKRLARQRLALDEAVLLIARVAETLTAAHARGLVHRDIKPSNLFLPEGDLRRVKILDFGIVQLSNAPLHATSAGQVLGTPGYMAPEQARGDTHLDARADVFALGCVLFECITGRAPFVGHDAMAVQAKILLDEAERVGEIRHDVPRLLDDLVAAMLSKDPSRRPTDAAALVADISAIGEIGRGDPRSAVESVAAITAGEQRLLSIVMAGASSLEEGTGEAATLTPQEVIGVPLEGLREAARAYGGRLEPIADGTMVVTLEGTGAATDQAARAARCALVMRSIAPDLPMALATGRGDATTRRPVGDVIDQAARLLRSAERREGPTSRPGTRPILIDELTAGLLDARFETSGEAGVFALSGARDPTHGSRTLLGKSTPCVGRVREMATLEAIFQECVTEQVAHAVIIEGDAGVGKSRLRYEFLRARVEQEDPLELWFGRADPMSVGAPFGMITSAIRRGIGLADGAPLGVRQLMLRARVGQHVPAADRSRVTEFLGELLGVPFPDDQSLMLRVARQDPILMGDQMRRAWEDWLQAECAAHPVVIVLEDLQWGDLPSVQLVDTALRNLRDRALLILAIARPEVHQLFPSLWAGRPVTQMQLSELTKKASESLVRNVLGNLAPEKVARLVDRAAGNAFYLEELIRNAATGNDDELPGTVLAMVQARIEALPSEARRVLRAASVFGQTFWQGGVTALLGGEQTHLEIGAWLTELVDRELIARRGEVTFPGDPEYMFRHDLLREAAYAMLTPEDRSLGHRLAGEWLERAGSTNAVALAEHFERGGRSDRAVIWYKRAAEQALEGNEYQAVRARTQRGVACGAQGEMLGQLRLLQSEAHRWLGSYRDAEEAALEAAQLLPETAASRLTALGNVAIASALRGNVELVVTIGERLRALEAREELGAAQVVAWARTAAWLLRFGKESLAHALLARVEETAPKIAESDPAVAARLHYSRALAAHYRGDLGVYLELSEASAQSFEEAGMTRNLCVQQRSVGAASLALGLHDRAERSMRRVLEDARRLGLFLNAAEAKQSLAVSLARRGALEEASVMAREAVRDAGEQGARWIVARAGIDLALILEQAGDFGGALSQAAAALDAASNNPPIKALALAALGQVRLARGEIAGALECTREAVRIVESLGRTEDGDALVRLAHGRALDASNDAETKRFLADAAERVRSHGAKISDPELRKSFLELVPENAALLALAARHL